MSNAFVNASSCRGEPSAEFLSISNASSWEFTLLPNRNSVEESSVKRRKRTCKSTVLVQESCFGTASMARKRFCICFSDWIRLDTRSRMKDGRIIALECAHS